jgi:putative membrane protein
MKVGMAKIIKQLKAVKRKEGLTLSLSLISFFIGGFLLFKEYYKPIDLNGLTLQDWTSVTQSAVIFISAIIAVCTITSTRKTSKERATLDVVLGDYQDKDLVEASNMIFILVREDRNQLFTVFQNEDGKKANERSSLLLVLNRYEFYASAMNHGILDEQLFKRLHCSNFIKLWDAVSPTVMSIRDKERKDTLFKDLEILVLRWKSNPLSVDDL